MNRSRIISRRGFLGAATAALAAGASSASLLSAEFGENPPGKLRIGGHPWVYASRLPKRDITPKLEEIFADMEYAGLDGIELMPNVLLPDDAVERLGELSQKHHVPILGASWGGRMFDRGKHNELLEEAERIIARVAKLGGRNLGTTVGKGPKLKSPVLLDAQADLLRKLIKLGEAHGVTVNLHNHTFEIENDLYDLKNTLERVPEAKLGPDLGWLARGGVDPVAFIRQFGPKIVFLHLRDQTADNRWSEALGEGAMDYPGIAKALREVGFQGDAVIELSFEEKFNPTRPIRESLKMSCEFARRLLA